MAEVPADHFTDVGLTWRSFSGSHIVTATWRRMEFKVEERGTLKANRLYVTRNGRPVRLPGWREAYVIGREDAERAIRAHIEKRRAVELDARAAVAAAADKPAKKWRPARVTPLKLSTTPDRDGFKINEFAPGDVIRWAKTDGRYSVECIGQVWSEAGSDYTRNDRTAMTGYFVVVQSEGKRTLSRPRAVRMIFASTPGGTVGWFIGDAQVTSLGDAGHAQLDLLEEFTRAQSAPVEPVVETPAPAVEAAPVAQPVEDVRDRFERGAAVWVAPEGGATDGRYVGEVMGYTRNGCFRVREAGYGTSVDVPADRLSSATEEEATADRARQRQECEERAAEKERRNAEARERAAAAEAEFAAKREARVPCPRCGVRLVGRAGAGMEKCGNPKIGRCGYVIGSWSEYTWRDGYTLGFVDGYLSYVPKTAEELAEDARLDAMGKTFRSARVWARKRTDKDTAKDFAKAYATGGGVLPVDESAWLRWCEENGKTPAAPAEKSAESAGLDRDTTNARPAEPVDAEEAARAARALCPACKCREMVVEDGRCQECGHVPAPAAAPVEPVVEAAPAGAEPTPEAVAEEEARRRRRAAHRITAEAGRAARLEAGAAIQARRRAERGPDPEFPGVLVGGEDVEPMSPGWAQTWWLLRESHGFGYEINQRRDRWYVMAQVGVILGTTIPANLADLGRFDTVEEALAAAREHAQQRATAEAGTMLVERVRRLAAMPVQYSTAEVEAGPVAIPARVAPAVEAAPPAGDRAPVGGAARPGPVRASDGPAMARTDGTASVLPEGVEAVIERAVEAAVEGVLARFGQGPGAVPAAAGAPAEGVAAEPGPGVARAGAGAPGRAGGRTRTRRGPGRRRAQRTRCTRGR
ncbi:hypothetical protein AB0C76_33140 [Kitasatospora sp. NPDC048722]|uniref:hypothetical protein n=1 Tax=Kitasatospora sp. NPDC048722 TaxID=3155639 RepID=UPI00340894F7